MKKLLLVLAVAGFVACNNGGTEETKDSITTNQTDTPVVTPPADTVRVDTSNVNKPDTTKK